MSLSCHSVALVCNPNCGKTTLFNALTGARQKVGNWPGVTVERKSGHVKAASKSIEVIDLPGLYSLILASDTSAIDERIACEFIQNRQVDWVINIVDASHLERHLYLTIELLEMGIPVILALNMMDVARARGIRIDLQKLSQHLGCHVIALEAHKKRGVDVLKRTILAQHAHCAKIVLPYPDVMQHAMIAIKNKSEMETWFAMRLLENDVYAERLVSPVILENVIAQKAKIKASLGEEADILFADTRYRFISEL